MPVMSRGSHRLFVAVDPPPAVAAELTSWARAHRGPAGRLRPVAPGNVHLTLAFLGELHEHDVDPVLRALHGAVHEWTLTGGRGPIPLELGAPAWLPPRRPRALAVDVLDPTGDLRGLQTRLAQALDQEIGWSDEHPRFRPHVTAARLTVGRDYAPPPLDPTPSQAFTVDEAVLYRSFLHPDGVRYEPLAVVALV